MKPDVIAIDGPAASGKTTIADLLAAKHGYIYLDTGLMYRAVTLDALRQQADLDNEDQISQTARDAVILVKPPSLDDGRKYDVILNGQDVTWELRTAEVDANVSKVSAYPGVREAMTNQQRQIARQGGIILAGRDIGTVVLPDADLKIYLEASAEARANRRWLELRSRGIDADVEVIHQAMIERDLQDSSRALAPLRPADDAVIIDTDHLSVAQVMDAIEALMEQEG